MKDTKTKLISSLTVMLVCCAMLACSTLAWFTDTASTGINRIESGNLDIVLNRLTGAGVEVVDTNTHLFDNIDKWEPGVVAYENLTVENVGNLAAKVEMKLRDYEKTLTNDGHALTEVIRIAVKDGHFAGSRDEVIADANTVGFGDLEMLNQEFDLLPRDTKNIGIALYWEPTDYDNQYNVNGGLSIQFALDVFATQKTEESDSFDNQYDANAPYVIYDVSTAEEFVEAVKKTDEYVAVNLMNDISVPISDLGTQIPGSGEYRLGGNGTHKLKIVGNSHKLTLETTYMSALGMNNPDGLLVLDNMTLTSTSTGGTWNIYDLQFIGCNVRLDHVNALKSVAFNNPGKVAIVENSEINETASTGDAYALWIVAGGNVTIDNTTINAKSATGNMNRAIKIADEYVWNGQGGSLDASDVPYTALIVKDSVIKSDKKAAVLVTSVGGANIEWNSSDISEVVADTTNAVWVDSDRASYDSLVNVSGCSKVLE